MKREVKIGLFAVAMIVAAWAGIRFLKGFDIFSRNAEYYAAYDRIDGVQSASPVMMQGVKIGSVTGVAFDPGRSDKVVLQLTIKREYRIPSDSEAKIFSNGLMGNKAIEIVYGTAPDLLREGDTLRSSRNRDLMDMAGSEMDFMKQKVAQITSDLSRALDNLNRLMERNADNIAATLDNLNRLTGDAAGLLASERQNLQRASEGLSRFATTLGENSGRVDSIVRNLNDMTGELAEQRLAERLTETVDGLNRLLADLRAGEGTAGKLMTDPALYDSLTLASGNLAALLGDLKEYPSRYVHFSLFGRDPEKLKAKAQRKAAREAERAERDSLKKVR